MIDAAELLPQEMADIVDHLVASKPGHRPDSLGHRRWMGLQAQVAEDVARLDSLIYTTCCRVSEQEKVGTAERVLSIADP